MILLEITFRYNSLVMRGFYKSERAANNARKKLADEIKKGQFRNDDDVLDIAHEAGVMSVKTSNVSSVCVYNTEKGQAFATKPETE